MGAASGKKRGTEMEKYEKDRCSLKGLVDPVNVTPMLPYVDRTLQYMRKLAIVSV